MAMRPYYKPKLVNIAGLRATSERLPSPVEMNGTTSDFIEFSFDKYQIIIFPFYALFIQPVKKIEQLMNKLSGHFFEEKITPQKCNKRGIFMANNVTNMT